MSPDGVVVDTSLWVDFFRGTVPSASAVERLIVQGEAVTSGIILAELLQGVKRPSEEQQIIEVFGGLPVVELTTAMWKVAGQTGSALRRKGITLPLSDLAIAAIALEHGFSVYTRDKHFDQIPNVKRYRPH